MAEVVETVIATNRYAPGLASDVKLYSAIGVDATGSQLELKTDMTLAQLVSAVTMRVAMVCEKAAALVSDRVTGYALDLDALKAVTLQVAGNASYTDRANLPAEYRPKTAAFRDPANRTVRNFLVYECGLTELPNALGNKADRLECFNRIKDKIDSLTKTNQQLVVDIQSFVSRREVAFSTGASVIKSLGSIGSVIANGV